MNVDQLDLTRTVSRVNNQPWPEGVMRSLGVRVSSITSGMMGFLSICARLRDTDGGCTGCRPTDELYQKISGQCLTQYGSLGFTNGGWIYKETLN